MLRLCWQMGGGKVTHLNWGGLYGTLCRVIQYSLLVTHVVRQRNIFEQPNRRLRNRMSGGVRGWGLVTPILLNCFIIPKIQKEPKILCTPF